MKQPLKKLRWWMAFAALIVLNLLASVFHERIDLTNENRFTISEPVKDILKNIDGQIEISIFLQGNLPSGFKKLSVSAQELLQEFKAYSNGNVQYNVISAEEKIPGTEITYADTLSALGMVPINLKVQLESGEQSQYVYPGALIHYRGSMQPVFLYSGASGIITPQKLNTTEALLEYKFANAILKMIHPQKPMIAYATGNGEPTGANTYDLVENVLTKDYKVFTMDLTQEPVIPDTFKLLMIVKPTIPFSNAEKLKIDQYVMNGGKLICFIDRLEAQMDSLQIKNQVIAYDRNLELDNLFFKYGVRINPDLIMDLQSDYLPFSVNGKDQFEFLKWNYFPLFTSMQNHIINKNLGLVAGKFVNSIDTVNAPGITQTILLSSSGNSRTIETPALISGTENRNTPMDAAFNKKGIPAGVLLEGKFTSYFKNRIGQPLMDSLASYGTPFVSESPDNKMIIVSDGDIVLNETFKGQLLPMGANPYTVGSQSEFRIANRQFVQNCIEFLINDATLSAARSKDYTLQLLDSKKIKNEKGYWQILNLGLPILLIILGGFIYQYLRKKKYTSLII